MSAFSLGGKTKVIFSKIGLFLLVCAIVMAVFGACSKNAGSDENIAAAKVSSTALAYNVTGVTVWDQV